MEEAAGREHAVWQSGRAAGSSSSLGAGRAGLKLPLLGSGCDRGTTACGLQRHGHARQRCARAQPGYAWRAWAWPEKNAGAMARARVLYRGGGWYEAQAACN